MKNITIKPQNIFQRKNISFKSIAPPQKNMMPSVFAEFSRDSYFSTTQVIEKDNFINKKTLIGVGIASAIAVGIALATKNTNQVKKVVEVDELQQVAKKLDDLFPQDAIYRKKIASAIGLNTQESYKLSSIVGTEELTKVTKEFEQTPEIYAPGTPNYTYREAVANFNNENVENGIFGANLHFHTDNSDGELSVKELLEKTVEYADKRFEKLKKPFYLAITDHDGVNGCKEAVEIVSQNPNKFKNLKLILGIENTFGYENREFLNEKANIHVLSYCVNPYSEQLDGLFGDKIKKNIANIKNAIASANEEFDSVLSKDGVKYEFDDMTKISKAIGVGIKNATYYMKDYLQFKYIFTKNVLNNKELCSELASAGVDLTKIDFAEPIKRIGKDLDYSKGQKYYDYYYEATKDYIASFVDDTKKSKISTLFPNIHLKDRVFLQKIEDKSLTPSSSLYVKANEYWNIEEGLAKLSQLEDGVIGMAHPGVIFPYGAIKYQKRLPDMYEDLYRIFKEKGGAKAIFAEDNYQTYYKSNHNEYYDKLKEIASKYGLIKTGGLDTHGTDIFSV